MKYDNLYISYPLQNINSKNIITTPFRINIRTSDGLIEKKCQELFPDLMTASFYDAKQLIRLQQMKTIIKNALLKNDLEQILKIFYDGKYLYPLNPGNKFVKLELTSYDCKVWTNNEPRLELAGNIIIDLEGILKHYYDTKLIKIVHNKKLLKQNISLIFAKPFPLLLVYEKSSDCYNKVLELIKKWINDKNCFFNKDLVKLTKNQRFNDLTKQVTWINNFTIDIAMNDLSENIINKLKNNKGKIAFGYLLYKSLK